MPAVAADLTATANDQRYLAKLRTQWKTNKSFPPSLAKLADPLGMSSTGSVFEMVARLEEVGCLTHKDGRVAPGERFFVSPKWKLLLPPLLAKARRTASCTAGSSSSATRRACSLGTTWPKGRMPSSNVVPSGTRVPWNQQNSVIRVGTPSVAMARCIRKLPKSTGMVFKEHLQRRARTSERLQDGGFGGLVTFAVET